MQYDKFLLKFKSVYISKKLKKRTLIFLFIITIMLFDINNYIHLV